MLHSASHCLSSTALLHTWLACTVQIVRRIVDDVLGKERKSMRDIMGALVVKVRAVLRWPCCACYA